MVKKVILIFLLGLGLFINQSLLAESIKFKSGKTIIAPIIDETKEYIVIDLQGLPIKYYFDEIEQIEGRDDKTNHNKEKIFYDQQNDPIKWNEWHLDKERYIQESKEIITKSLGLTDEYSKKINKALAQSNFTTSKLLLGEYDESMDNLLIQVNTIRPPQGFETYHQHIFDSCIILQDSLSSRVNRETNGPALKITALTHIFDAKQEIKSLYLEHGASDKDIDEIENIVNEYIKVLTNKEGL